MTHGKQVLQQLQHESAELRVLIPTVYEGYSRLHKAAVQQPGALDVKTKELMALAIAVRTQCDGCLASHARGAARAGATKEQVAEAIGVAILMGGGPSTVYGPRAFAAFTEFQAQYAAADSKASGSGE